MTSTKEIVTVIKTIEATCKQFQTPSVTAISEEKRNPFHVLISCILSLRTKDNVTVKASARLFALAETPEALLSLSLKQIEQAIYPVGFYKTKAKNIKDICATLLEKYDGNVPKDIDKLMELRGVGRKTATICMVYGHQSLDYIPADVHVHVIANRLGWVNTTTPEDTEQGLMRVVPKQYWRLLNDLFVKFGQNICITVSPWCSKCPVGAHCKRVGVTRSR